MISHENNVAVFKASITLSNEIGGYATGWGSEGYDDFRDYLEKAETKAIGRALAALGFGTQFTPDFDFSGDSDKVVDAPVRMTRNPENRSAAMAPAPQGGQQRVMGNDGTTRPPAQPGTHITDRQIGFVRTMAREKGISEQVMSAQLQDKYDEPDLTKLERRDASNYIELLKAYQPSDKATAPEEYEPVVNQQTGEIIESVDDIPF